MCSSDLLDSPIEFVSTVQENTYYVKVDCTQMESALSGIITNAIEAMESDGRVAISAEKISIDESTTDPKLMELAPGEYVMIKIKDNGKGMDQRTMEHIFDPFFSTKFTGRGLSMAAAYGIVKNHAGEINIESQVGEGTTVTIYLPLAR